MRSVKQVNFQISAAIDNELVSTWSALATARGTDPYRHLHADL